MTPRPNVLAMARQVGQRAAIACLTNNGLFMRDMMGMIFPEARALFGERMFFSAELGVGKPKPQVFLAVLERVGGVPARALFIDDSAEYIGGAEAAGLHTHQYRDEARLRRTLEGFGLL
jgi:FMN phosphatase YigB (HAD superfamily)